MHRRHLLLGAGTLTFASLFTSQAWAANPAEDFVSNNIQSGFDILNDRNASPAERRDRFATFLLGLTDVKRVALFLLGRYASAAPQDDLDAYVAAGLCDGDVPILFRALLRTELARDVIARARAR
jgi:ABC-type transporter MlaC component